MVPMQMDGLQVYGIPSTVTEIWRQAVGEHLLPRFDGDTVPLKQPRSGSGLSLHPKETVGQFRTHFQAYKPSIWEEESFRRYMESREEALPAGTQRPWWKFWGTG